LQRWCNPYATLPRGRAARCRSGRLLLGLQGLVPELYFTPSIIVVPEYADSIRGLLGHCVVALLGLPLKIRRVLHRTLQIS